MGRGEGRRQYGMRDEEGIGEVGRGKGGGEERGGEEGERGRFILI